MGDTIGLGSTASGAGADPSGGTVIASVAAIRGLFGPVGCVPGSPGRGPEPAPGANGRLAVVRGGRDGS